MKVEHDTFRVPTFSTYLYDKEKTIDMGVCCDFTRFRRLSVAINRLYLFISISISIHVCIDYLDVHIICLRINDDTSGKTKVQITVITKCNYYITRNVYKKWSSRACHWKANFFFQKNMCKNEKIVLRRVLAGVEYFTDPLPFT